MTLRETIGARIREARERAGMSQEQLASAIGSEAATVSRYETARRAISLEIVEQIARALNITTMELVAGSPSVAGRKLKVDERELLSTYRSMKPTYRRLALRLLRELRRND
jgi:ribosome-binding protein aMBF1 (putative translation factor)